MHRAGLKDEDFAKEKLKVIISKGMAELFVADFIFTKRRHYVSRLLVTPNPFNIHCLISKLIFD